MLNEQTSASGRVARALLLAFVLATCLRVWLGPLPVVGEARAQIPNAGEQRLELVREVQRTNQLLQSILTTLQNDTLKVTMDGTDNKKGPQVQLHGGKRP